MITYKSAGLNLGFRVLRFNVLGFVIPRSSNAGNICHQMGMTMKFGALGFLKAFEHDFCVHTILQFPGLGFY